MAYLAACALEGRAPDARRVGELDLERLYREAERHLLTGIVAAALESAGVRDKAFTQAAGKAVRKAAVLDLERRAVTDRLEEAGIWHMPLKGSVLGGLYPRLGMRQMSDVDILYDASRTAEVRAIMESLGFSPTENFGRGIRDHYFKPPVCNFELHRRLFAPSHDPLLEAYYGEIKGRMLPDKGKTYAFHLREEDFYLYHVAHAYKHYASGGTGLRSLLDTFVYCRKKSEDLDWDYIREELSKLGLTEFEAVSRSLAEHLFGGGEVTGPEREMLERVVSSGAYGTEKLRVETEVEKRGRLGYLLSRAFPEKRIMELNWPVLKRWPVLLPLCWLLRLGKAWRGRRKRMLTQFRLAFRRE